MNIHKLTPPRDCPKCGYEGNFRGPHYRDRNPILWRMQWGCKVCGFQQTTMSLDVAKQLEEEGKERDKERDMSEWQPIKTAPDDTMVLVHWVFGCITCVAIRVDRGRKFPWTEQFCWFDDRGDSITEPTYWKPMPDVATP